jgi:hypothetical protein
MYKADGSIHVPTLVASILGGVLLGWLIVRFLPGPYRTCIEEPHWCDWEKYQEWRRLEADASPDLSGNAGAAVTGFDA